MAKPTNTNAAATNAAATPTNATKAPSKAATTTPLPQANVVPAPSGRSTTTMVCMPGTVYGIAVQHNGNTVVLPFTLPGKCTTPAPVVVASTNANWLGRNGAPLCVWACTTLANPKGMGVALQPHGTGYKANAYTAGLHTVQM